MSGMPHPVDEPEPGPHESFPCGHPRDERNTRWGKRANGASRAICRACHATYCRARYTPRSGGWARRTEARLEDFDMLTETGTPFDEIARRLGLKPDSLRWWLYRHGRGWSHG